MSVKKSISKSSSSINESENADKIMIEKPAEKI